MTDPAQTQATGQVAVVPTPSCIRPQRVAGEQAPGTVAPGLPTGRDAGARRSTAREALEGALAGIRLSFRDNQFLARLVHWDKRNAISVAALLVRARQAGREEGGLTPRQLEVVLAALGDAAIYRTSGAAGMDCWDCEIIAGGRCAYHAKDNDRARSYAELAVSLSGSALSGTALSGPVLSEAGTGLSGAGLSGAPLAGAGLAGAGLSSAGLADASTTQADLPVPMPRHIAGYRRKTPVAS
jgi:hypothetical protein